MHQVPGITYYCKNRSNEYNHLRIMHQVSHTRTKYQRRHQGPGITINRRAFKPLLLIGSIQICTMQDFLRFKNGHFLPLLFVTSFLNLLFEFRTHFIFSYDTETTCTTYQVPGIYTAAARTAAAVVYSRYPDRMLYEKDDAVRIEPRPPSPSTCRLCARISRTLLRPQPSGDGTRMQSVLDESRASC